MFVVSGLWFVVCVAFVDLFVVRVCVGCCLLFVVGGRLSVVGCRVLLCVVVCCGVLLFVVVF